MSKNRSAVLKMASQGDVTPHMNLKEWFRDWGKNAQEVRKENAQETRKEKIKTQIII